MANPKKVIEVKKSTDGDGNVVYEFAGDVYDKKGNIRVNVKGATLIEFNVCAFSETMEFTADWIEFKDNDKWVPNLPPYLIQYGQQSAKQVNIIDTYKDDGSYQYRLVTKGSVIHPMITNEGG